MQAYHVWGMDDAGIVFRSEPGAAELRRLARRESGRVCQRVLMIANLLEGMEHEEAARLAGLNRARAQIPAECASAFPPYGRLCSSLQIATTKLP